MKVTQIAITVRGVEGKKNISRRFIADENGKLTLGDEEELDGYFRQLFGPRPGEATDAPDVPEAPSEPAAQPAPAPTPLPGVEEQLDLSDEKTPVETPRKSQ